MDANSATYTVLARRYRPQGFDEVVGQEHVAQSLRNAIRTNRVAHAYLFTGARGVGKTSMARILAKALNCPNAVDGVPCNRCDVCENVAAGRDLDVLEIDGASNRGIEDIRTLRANVGVKSMRTKYKIYIIDEVHMLTREAFNALLKTLEEPPPNVKFVFCTTEPTKVPDTILSRCQRFDFGTIALAQIIGRLADIAKAENVEVEPAALELVARRAAGSMRDSQSLFDQLLAGAEKQITAAEVHRLLGTASDERLIGLFDAIIARQRSQSLDLFGQALADGAQLEDFAAQMLNYIRDLMVLAAGADNVPLLSVSETNRATLTNQAQAWGVNTIVAALQILSEAKLKMFRQTFGRALVELAVIRLTLLEQLQSLDALLNELASAQLANIDLVKKKPESTTVIGRVISPDRDSASQTAARGLPDSTTTVMAEPVSASAEPARPVQPPPEAGVLDPSIVEPATNRAASSAEFRPGAESAFWTQLLSEVGDDLGIHLRRAGRVAIVGPNRLELSFPKSYLFAKSYCERPEVRSRLEEIASRLAGQPVQFAMAAFEDGTSAESSAAVPAASRRMDLSTNGDPYVEKALELFNAKVVKKESLAQTSPSPEG